MRRRLGFYIVRFGGWVAGVHITAIKPDRKASA